jgi:uridine phosphorylase
MPADAIPLVEFDADPEAVVQPRPLALTEPMPSRAVVCFFHEVIADVAQQGARQIGAFSAELGGHPIYRLTVGDQTVAVFHPGVGAPLSVLHLEQAIASGVRKVIACGGAGAVIPGLALGHVIVPTAALRDEGTSYHYCPPTREVLADPASVAAATAVLDERGVPYTLGKTWTTDAPFRETAAKIQARRDEGCVTVEMETAAFLAVTRARRVAFAQYLYAGDDVSGERHDHRRWTTASARRDLFWLAFDAVHRL